MNRWLHKLTKKEIWQLHHDVICEDSLKKCVISKGINEVTDETEVECSFYENWKDGKKNCIYKPDERCGKKDSKEMRQVGKGTGKRRYRQIGRLLYYYCCVRYMTREKGRWVKAMSDGKWLGEL